MAAKWVRGVQARMFKDTAQFAIEDWIPFLSTQLGSNWTVETTAAYYKDPFGVVRLKGRMDATLAPTTDQTICTLPVGYRPDQLLRFAVASNNNVGAGSAASIAAVTVATDGTISFLDTSTGEPYAVTTDVWLDQITFRALVDDK